MCLLQYGFPKTIDIGNIDPILEPYRALLILCELWASTLCYQILQLIKTLLAFLIPLKFSSFLQKRCHGLSNLRKSFNKSPIISCESQETPNLRNCSGHSPLHYLLYFSRIHSYSSIRNNMTKEWHPVNPKLALAELSIELIIS